MKRGFVDLYTWFTSVSSCLNQFCVVSLETLGWLFVDILDVCLVSLFQFSIVFVLNRVANVWYRRICQWCIILVKKHCVCICVCGIETFFCLTPICLWPLKLVRTIFYSRCYHMYLPLSVASFACLISLTIRFSLGFCIRAPVSTWQLNHMLLQLSCPAKTPFVECNWMCLCLEGPTDKTIHPLLILQNNNQKNSMEIIPHTVY